MIFSVTNTSTLSNPKAAIADARKALSHRLFVNGWQLREYLIDITDMEITADIALAYNENQVPIGVAITRKDNGFTMVFVRKKYRKQGVGTALVSRLKKENPRGIWFSDGISGSEKFAQKVNCRCC